MFVTRCVQSIKSKCQNNCTYVCVWENLFACAPMHRLPLCMASSGSSQHGNGQTRGVYLANIRHIWHLFIYIPFTHTYVHTDTRTCGFPSLSCWPFQYFLDSTIVIDISYLRSTELYYSALQLIKKYIFLGSSSSQPCRWQTEHMDDSK